MDQTFLLRSTHVNERENNSHSLGKKMVTQEENIVAESIQLQRPVRMLDRCA